MKKLTTYGEKLLDPRWQKKRLDILNRDGFKCRICDDKEMTLHVHHRYYVKGRDPWDYPDFSLITLCVQCHDMQPEFADRPERWELALDAVADSNRSDVWLMELLLKTKDISVNGTGEKNLQLSCASTLQALLFALTDNALAEAIFKNWAKVMREAVDQADKEECLTK